MRQYRMARWVLGTALIAGASMMGGLDAGAYGEEFRHRRRDNVLSIRRGDVPVVRDRQGARFRANRPDVPSIGRFRGAQVSVPRIERGRQFTHAGPVRVSPGPHRLDGGYRANIRTVQRPSGMSRFR